MRLANAKEQTPMNDTTRRHFLKFAALSTGEYTMYEDTRAIIVYVQIDPAGRVREVFQVRDPFYDSRGSGKT
jgi:hypothetical protein